MSRYIDADAIDYRFDRIQDQSPDFIGGVIYANACVQDAPSIDIPQWIPCSERLPEVHEEPYYADHEAILHESDHVLTCCKCGKGFVYAIGTVIHDEVCDSYEWSDLYDYAEYVIDDMQVLAWMPLPKPYKERSK